MEMFSRERQREILQELREAYPEELDFKAVIAEDESGDTIRNLHYLHERGLIEARLVPYVDNPESYALAAAKLTADGIDFLAEDGGLRAILGVVTIKIHEDSLKDLIALRIQEAPLAPADKKKWSDALRALPADATKHLAMKLVDLGLAHGHDGLRLLEKWLGLT
ncbi:MAG: hypothetical protein GAK28_03200 [Luteibacter sp.]|nr:MAG: hypothetical protein GAK28_03200 [Luteibacter sp.]